MKNLKKIVFGLLAMLVMVTSVNAAEVKGPNAVELKKCLKGTDEVCTLTEDITATGFVNVERDVTIDLNTHIFTIKDDVDLQVDAGVTLNLKNGTLVQESSDSYAVEVFGNIVTSNLKINVTGESTDGEGDTAAIWLRGDATDIATATISEDTEITVPHGNGLAFSDHINATLNGKWETYYSTIYADGANSTSNVTINGGNYISTNANALKIIKGNWTINNGVFTSKIDDAVNISAIPKKAENLSVIINDGTFITNDYYHKPIHSGALDGSEALEGFIYGGIYETPNTGLIDKYIAEGYTYITTSEKDVTPIVQKVVKPISIIVENVNDPVEKSDLQKTYSYDATGANTKLKQLYSGNTINLDEFLGIRALDNKYYKDYTAIITIKETGEKFYTKLYTNYNAGGMFGSYVIGPDDADNSFVLPKEDVTVTIEFVKTETLKPHTVEVAADIINGKVSVGGKTEANEGEIINITVTPNEGYEVSKVFVNGVEITANEDGTYSYVMGVENIVVSAEFKKVETPVQPQNPTGDGSETESGKGDENNNTGSTNENEKPNQNTTENKPADEVIDKNSPTLDSIVSIVTLAISSLGTAGYSIKKFIRK